MSEKIVHATAQDFDSILKDNKVVLVDFWAEWCGPCRMVGPIMEQLAEDYAGRAVVAKVDVDAEQELAMRFGVQSIPTIILFKDGELVKKEIGAKPITSFTALLDQAL